MWTTLFAIQRSLFAIQRCIPSSQEPQTKYNYSFKMVNFSNASGLKMANWVPKWSFQTVFTKRDKVSTSNTAAFLLNKATYLYCSGNWFKYQIFKYHTCLTFPSHDKVKPSSIRTSNPRTGLGRSQAGIPVKALFHWSNRLMQEWFESF